MKHIKLLIAAVCLLAALPLQAVTDREMDQARAIACKTYLRYANDGSGYLDDLKVSSMAELEKGLRAKEKENIKAFKEIAVPTDYKAWDKAKLVEYWGVTAFGSPKLTAKGKVGKARARKLLGQMTVAAPTASPAPASEAAPAPEAKTNQEAAQAPADVAPPADSAAQTTPELSDEAASVALLQEEYIEEPISRESNHTWVYIVILVILVGAVVALVVFASNVMKRNEARMRRDESPVSDLEPSEKRDKLAGLLAEKNEEIRRLKTRIESLTAQVAQLQSQQPEERGIFSGPQERPVAGVQPRQETVVRPAVQPQPQPRNGRAIFLGRSNSKGYFVRADRVMTPGQSLYRLETTDGLSGTFRLVNDPEVWADVIAAGGSMLTGAAQVQVPEEGLEATRIVTDGAGTAILDNNYWKVVRKAKVHFE